MDLGHACRRGSRGALFVALGVFAAAFVGVALLRLRHPFEIEWMEGGMLTHAARLLDGKPIYARPSTDFVAFFYTPLYSATVALLAKLFGLTFALGRGVSLAATLATAGLLFHIGRREASAASGAVAAGLYLAHFRFCGAFFDVARPDSLSLAILLAGAWRARVSKSFGGIAFAGVLFALAFLTKQTSSVFAPVVAIALFFERGWRRAAVFAITAFAVAAIGCAWLEHRSAGWFWFYVFEGHQAHKFYWKNILLEYWRDVLFLAPTLLVVPIVAMSTGRWTRWIALAGAALVVVAFGARAIDLRFEEHMYYREVLYEKTRSVLLVPPLVVAALAVWARVRDRESGRSSPPPFGSRSSVRARWRVASITARSGAYSNCFMPIALFGSLAVALSLPLERATATWPSAALAAAIVVGLAPLAYNPSDQLPAKGRWRAGSRCAIAAPRRRRRKGPRPRAPDARLRSRAHDSSPPDGDQRSLVERRHSGSPGAPRVGRMGRRPRRQRLRRPVLGGSLLRRRSVPLRRRRGALRPHRHARPAAHAVARAELDTARSRARRQRQLRARHVRRMDGVGRLRRRADTPRERHDVERDARGWAARTVGAGYHERAAHDHASASPSWRARRGSPTTILEGGAISARTCRKGPRFIRPAPIRRISWDTPLVSWSTKARRTRCSTTCESF